MSPTFILRIITPEKTLFSGPVTQVTAPGEEGEFGVLAGHTPMIIALKEGVVKVEQPGAETESFPIHDGVAEITNDHCTLLISQAA